MRNEQRIHIMLGSVPQGLIPNMWSTVPDQLGDMDGRFDVAQRIMSIMACKAIGSIKERPAPATRLF